MLAEKTLGKVRPQSITFPSAVEIFLAEKTKARRAGTVANLKQRLERHFPFKGQLADISHQDIARKLTRIKSNSEHDHALAVAKTFFNWCHNRRYITDSPVRGLSPHGHTARSRVLADAEIKQVWDACDDETNEAPPPFLTIVKLLIATGQRRGEIGALRTSYIEGDITTLPATLTKNNRQHLFPNSALAADILRGVEVTGNDAIFFPARGKPNKPFNGWSKAKAQLDAKITERNAGVPLPRWTLHDLRRTFATRLAEMGTPIHVVEKLLNHISGTTGGLVAVYNKAQYWDEQVAAISKWNDRLFQLLEKP